MRKIKKWVRIGQAAGLVCFTAISCLLSSWYLEGAGPEVWREQITEWGEAAGAFAIGRFYPQLTYRAGGGSCQALSEAYLDPAYACYVRTQVQGAAGRAEERQVLLLSELNGGQASDANSGQPQTQTESPAGSWSGDSPEGAAIPTALARIGQQYSLEQLADFDFLVKHFYTVHSTTAIWPEQLNAPEFLGRDLRFAVDPSGPQVLIYHTHYSEMYADSDPNDLNSGVIGVGNHLAELLESRYGLQVLHDTTPYEYNSSYSRAGQRVAELLAANPGIRVVIDLHRDAGGAEKMVTQIDGKETAQIMFFNGLCQTPDGPLPGLSNPYLSDCLAFSLQMKIVSEAWYPGLARKNYLKAYQYNQHMCPLSTLIEVGADNNTFSEAYHAMEPLADILGKVLVK